MIPIYTSKIHRNTRQRAALLAELEATKVHPTAATLFEKLKKDDPKISLGTVYRNLSFLVDEGAIHVIRPEKGPDRFDAVTRVHYHVECTHCGKVSDVELSPEKVAVDCLFSQAELFSGYSIASHRIHFSGLCPTCQNASAVDS